MLIIMILGKKPRRSSDCSGRPPALKLNPGDAKLSLVRSLLVPPLRLFFSLLFLRYFVMTHTEAEKRVRGSMQALCGGQNVTFSSRFSPPAVASGAQHGSWGLLSKSEYILNHLTCPFLAFKNCLLGCGGVHCSPSTGRSSARSRSWETLSHRVSS